MSEDIVTTSGIAYTILNKGEPEPTHVREHENKPKATLSDKLREAVNRLQTR